ncbi:MAG: DUF4392 domain-containing protein, partial [Gammaproteobacteria bacterium]|nr:DUF4392 domain-containing protein [Gammaproteobacteria bacterium]
VFIITGSLSRATVTPSIAENDGPMGAAAIARALSVGFNAIPVVISDEAIIGKLAMMLEVAGCNVMSFDEARAATDTPRFTQVASTATIPSDPTHAAAHCAALIEKYQPACVVTIERAGMTADGTYRNALGQDYSEGRAHLDYLIDVAAERGTPTVGIGDGGNELGMGAVQAAVHEFVPHGPILCAERATDVLLPAGVSNWGGYAIAAALAISQNNPDLAHSVERERRMLEAAPGIGLIDGSTGRLDPTADGMPLAVHLSIVELLCQAVRSSAKA